MKYVERMTNERFPCADKDMLRKYNELWRKQIRSRRARTDLRLQGLRKNMLALTGAGVAISATGGILPL